MKMSLFLTYATPPLLGAAIGYITNYVAIRMLFKPHKAWHLFGIRIPLTPGIIPLKRHTFAKNIGEIVGEKLLTGQDLSKAVTREEFQRELRGVIDTRISKILNTDLGTIASIIPKRFLRTFQVSVEILRLRFLECVHDYVNSDEFARQVNSAVAIRIEEFCRKDIRNFLAPGKQDQLIAYLESAAVRFLARPQVEKWIRSLVRNKAGDIIARGCSIYDLLPREVAEMVLDKIEKEAPGLVRLLSGLIERPATQERIAKKIAGVVSGFAGALGPLAGIVSGFLNPETVERKVRDYLHEKGEDISNWFLDETAQRKLAVILREKADRLMKTPISDLLPAGDPEAVNKISDMLAGGILSAVRDPEVLTTVGGLVRKELAAQTNRPLNDILTDIFGEDGSGQGKSQAARQIITVIRSPEARRLLDDLVEELVEHKLLALPIGTLASFLTKEVQQSFVDYVLSQTTSLLLVEIPGLVASLDIKDIVTQKVDSLNLIRLEGLLLSIMQEQFKYINLVGAVLGFIIGLLNLFFVSAG